MTAIRRRRFLQLSGMAGLGLLTVPVRAAEAGPIAVTGSGKVRGVTVEGIHNFKGIPYGADTSTTRFLPANKPTPWTGVRDALAYGHTAPQTRPGSPPPTDGMGDARETAPESEDCLVLNVWTPALNDGVKRPVMFWLHGGGFTDLSGSFAYDGTNLCKRGDVVVVTINHRLGALGFTHLAQMGDAAFELSGNVGMLDAVLALEWVRDNIERFGGDPNNVMIFGESGGGRKVATLLGMPPARGLFHRAVIESGPALVANERDYAHRYAQEFMRQAGVKPGQLRELQRLPLQRILAAQYATTAAMPRSNVAGGPRPVLDPKVLPRHMFEPDATPLSADIPVIVGYNRTEAAYFLMRDKSAWGIDEAGLRKAVAELFGANADEVIATLRKVHPQADPSELRLLAHSGFVRYNIDSIKLAERKAAARRAPVYLYQFAWETPIEGGKYRTPHSLEINFVFDNIRRSPAFSGGGPDAIALAAKVSSTWINFARTGNPNGGGLPQWQPYDASSRPTMVIRNDSALESDPGRAERELWEKLYFSGAKST